MALVSEADWQGVRAAGRRGRTVVFFLVTPSPSRKALTVTWCFSEYFKLSYCFLDIWESAYLAAGQEYLFVVAAKLYSHSSVIRFLGFLVLQFCA